MYIRKVVILMYVSIFAVYEYQVDAKALYDELRTYCKMNVTDLVQSVIVHGRFHEGLLTPILFILLKYGDPRITITK